MARCRTDAKAVKLIIETTKMVQTPCGLLVKMPNEANDPQMHTGILLSLVVAPFDPPS